MKYKREKVLKKVKKLLKRSAKNDNFSFFLAALEPYKQKLFAKSYRLDETGPAIPTGTHVKIWSHSKREGRSRPLNATSGLAKIVRLKGATAPSGWEWVCYSITSTVELVPLERIEVR